MFYLNQKIDQTFSLNDLIDFALTNFSSKNRGISVTAATIIRQLTRGLIKLDQQALIERNSEETYSTKDDEDDMDSNKWHFLETFRDTLESYEEIIKELIEDFSFKPNEMDNDLHIAGEIIMPYFLLWHCILHFCSVAPADLRSYYAHWITLHKYEEVDFSIIFIQNDATRNFKESRNCNKIWSCCICAFKME
ncbi:hypothetical protein PVAND_011168 [Polypedilum vanderplanki]|uniref:Uncharacterized protein n=1 Tax=Polypedilum vanderplanki TaxID=319348 RepID=A0A9J6CIR6_POLVA|nr:hypothetical protein PVAND_011168 [Polypedilum vanderplanki]